MSINEMESKARELRELQALIDEATAEAEALKDALKAAMGDAEEVRAGAGIDIGGTLIGMHLRRVAVPVRLSLGKIGQAAILCARTRPKYIGGARAVYEEAQQ